MIRNCQHLIVTRETHTVAQRWEDVHPHAGGESESLRVSGTSSEAVCVCVYSVRRGRNKAPRCIIIRRTERAEPKTNGVLGY